MSDAETIDEYNRRVSDWSISAIATAVAHNVAIAISVVILAKSEEIPTQTKRATPGTRNG